MRALRRGRALGTRLGAEAWYAAVLARAVGPGPLLTPPHRYLGVARAWSSAGPWGTATALSAAVYGDRPAIIDERGTASFADLDATAVALAGALAGRGVRSGDGIGILCRNHRGLFEAFFAATTLGLRTVLLNTDFSGPQLADVCERENVGVLVYDEEFTDRAACIAPRYGRIVSWLDGESVADDPSVAQLVAAAGKVVIPRPDHRQQVVLLTSGTTGTPKGAPRALEPTLSAPGSYLSKIPLRANRRVFVASPIFHAWGLGSAMLAFALGSTIVMSRRAEPAATLDALSRHRCDTLITVPIVLARLLDAYSQSPDKYDLSALRVVAVSGSPLSAELGTRAMDLLGDVVYNLYGSTEVAYATIATPADLRAAPGTVGRPPYGTTVAILDAHGHRVADGLPGRVFVGNAVHFGGYTDGATKETVAGLMSTGDVGHFDDQGRLFIDGRDDDMIVSGGENVYPAEVTDLLVGHPRIADAAVVGVPDEEYGQRLRAYVVRSFDAVLDEAEVREHVKANLARFKVPREVVFVDAIPRNAAGKVVKRELPTPQQ